MSTLEFMVIYDAFDPRWITDPIPLFDQILEENPVHLSAQNFWVLSRHEDCLAILRSRNSSSELTRANPNESVQNRDSIGEEENREDDGRAFLFRDPPDHTRLRGLVAKAFTPKMVNELTPFIERRVTKLLDEVVGAGTLDIQETLCYPLPIAVISEMLGIPESDQDQFRTWSEILARGLDPDFLLPASVLEERDRAILEFAGYFLALLKERKAHPGDDLLSALALAEDDGDRLSEAEMISTSILLLVAGHETTVNLLTGSIMALAQDEHAAEQLRSNQGLWRTGIEEFMRMVSPVQLTGRTILEDVVVGDVVIPGGSFVMLLIAGANRDPAVFPSPALLDVTRDPNPQLGFGFGLHHCLGAPLARMEARITLQKLLERTRGITQVGAVTYRPNVVLRGVTELQVSLLGK